MKHPSLSVLIPNYNHAHYLPTCIEAILSQSFQPAEIVIIDDASTDQSVEVIESYIRKERHIRLIRNKRNMGILFNQNKFPTIAKGDYLVGCAADDKVLPGFFEKSIDLLEKYSQAGLCSSITNITDEQGNVKGYSWSPRIESSFITPQEALQLLKQHGSWISGNTVVYKRQALINSGGFIQELGSYTDGFIQEVIALRYGSCFIPEPLSSLRVLETSYSATYMANFEREMTVLMQANHLRRTTYQDIFPPEYIEIATRRWLYNFGISDWQRFESQEQNYLQLLSERLSFTKPSLLDPLVLKGWQFFVKLQGLMIEIFLTFRFNSRLIALKKLLRLPLSLLQHLIKRGR